MGDSAIVVAMVITQTMRSFRLYATFGLPIVVAAVLLLVLNTASPLSVGPLGILMVFGLIYALVLSALYAVLTLVIGIAGRFTNVRSVSKKKLYYMATIVGMGPIFILALNSIGQLDMKDFVLVVVLIVIACFYVTRRVKDV